MNEIPFPWKSPGIFGKLSKVAAVESGARPAGAFSAKS